MHLEEVAEILLGAIDSNEPYIFEREGTPVAVIMSWTAFREIIAGVCASTKEI